MTRARPAKPFSSTIRAASALHAETPDTARSAERSNQWKAGHPARAEPPEREHLGSGECERLLVDVDEVPGLAHRAPDRTRIVEEERRMPPDRRDAGDRLAGARLQAHHPPAFGPLARAQQGHVDAEVAEGAFAPPPLVHDGAMRYSQHAHVALQRRLSDQEQDISGAPTPEQRPSTRSKGITVTNGAFTVPAGCQRAWC